MIVHAAVLSSKNTSSNTFAVVLTAPDESALLRLEGVLSDNEIPFASFREQDYGSELMAIGIEPVERRIVRRHLSGFSLFGGALCPSGKKIGNTCAV